jgi:hypothetical protein
MDMMKGIGMICDLIIALAAINNRVLPSLGVASVQATVTWSNGGVEHQHRVRDGLVVAAALEELVNCHHAVVVSIHFLQKQQ